MVSRSQQKRLDIQMAAANDKDGTQAVDATGKVEKLFKKKRLPGVVQTEERRTIQAKYAFTPKEMSDMASKMAQRQLELTEKEDEKKTVMASFTDAVKSIKLNISKLSRGYRDGWEFRDYECVVVYDYKRREKKFRDVHTKKIVDSKPFAPGDEQRKFI